MELCEIKSFLAIADLGSISRAALRLGVPQPTLSRQISRLEQDLGAALLYRHGRGASLTDTGRQFREKVVPLIQDLERLRTEISARAGTDAGTVRLGIPQSVSRSIAASVAASFHRQCSPARLQLVEANSSTLAEWLADGEVDAAIFYEPHKAPHISVEPVYSEELFLITAAGPAQPAGPARIADIDPGRLILTTDGQGLRRSIEAAFDDAGRALDAAMEIDSIAAVKELIETEGFVGILPFGVVHREVEAGRLAARPILAGVPMTAELVVGTALSQPVTSATRQLLRIIGTEVSTFTARGILRGRARRMGTAAPTEERPARALHA